MNSHRNSAGADWVERAEPIEGVERIEAWFHGKAYAMHRHDTYAIGRTLAGVQRFSYRRGQCNSLPGHTIVLHPDEPHDGQAGTEEGFQYRMIYVQPSLFQDVLGGSALPFLEGGLTTDPRLSAATGALLQRMSHTLEPLEQNDALTELVHALAAITGTGRIAPVGDYRAARQAREFLHDHCTRTVALEELEAVTGRDRWSLSRDFRHFYGTSPYRYLTMRRLDAVRRMLRAGTALSHAAAAAGFADQSHMTRHFARAFGMTPGNWQRVARG
ncbi:AraC family transcriptional regulator [Paraburkholderia bannensis]|uniref:AraC family transcriptional regulator n=1 Tax=Paraburkholderia bannensis TaxID=765414 RepID=UPI0004801C50|nr:AraC family transcriptional regulator [Paraburkholderia bannensis]